jgi:hypothetical protein
MLSWQHVQTAIRPLRWISIGGIFWIVDITLTFNRGFRLDILDDTIGTLLITFGVFRLAAIPVGGHYRAVMNFVKVVAIASVVETAMKHFVFVPSTGLAVVLNILGLSQLAATILFCLAMNWFCMEAGMPQVARTWRITFVLFCVIYALPLGFAYFASFVAMTGGTSFHANVGPWALLLLPVFLLPVVFLFVSTSRMRRAAELGAAGQPPPPGGFPVVLPGQQ